MSWKVLITARTLDEVGQSAIQLLRKSGCELVIPPKYGPLPAETLQPLLEGNDAVLASMDKFTGDVLRSTAARQIKIISRWGVGYDAIDVPAATEQGVVIGYTPGLLNETVADFAFALLLGIARRIHIGHMTMAEGRWQAVWGHDVHGKTLGIIGCGRIGLAMARRAAGFNMRVLGYDVLCPPEAPGCGVTLVTGDTKVVDRGKGDGVFITTSGVGIVPASRRLSIHGARPGDRVIVSGTIGDHGIAIMSVREGIEFDTVLKSDTAPLNGLVEVMLSTAASIRAMRDPTRGGLASTLNEIATASSVGIKLDERSLPLRREVRAACEMLGLDPLYVACEGKVCAIVAPEDADRLLAAMRAHPLGSDAAGIGEIVTDHRGIVAMRTLIGGERVVSMLAGEQLPRIC